MILKVKKLLPEVQLPKKATKGSACFDVFYPSGSLYIYPFSATLLHTGLAFEVPEGYGLEIRPRSGLSSKGLIIPNSPGTLDSDYRGELLVSVFNISGAQIYVENGDRIAQIRIFEVLPTEIEEVAELSETIRGTGGFGSTGK